MDEVTTIRQASEGRLLTADEEQSLATLVHQGNIEARNLLVERNTRLVYSVLTDYRNTKVTADDLIQEGVIGLITAANKYEPGRGRFSTYAVYWIRQAMGRHIANDSRTMRLPVHVNEALAIVRRVTARLSVDLERHPTQAEIALASGLSVTRITNILEAAHITNMRLLSEPVIGLDRETKTIGENIADDTDYGEAAELSAHRSVLVEHVGAVLDMLPARQRRVIEMRFGFGGAEPMTLADIGRELRLTRERVRQLESEALEVLTRIVGRSQTLQEAA